MSLSPVHDTNTLERDQMTRPKSKLLSGDCSSLEDLFGEDYIDSFACTLKRFSVIDFQRRRIKLQLKDDIMLLIYNIITVGTLLQYYTCLNSNMPNEYDVLFARAVKFNVTVHLIYDVTANSLGTLLTRQVQQKFYCLINFQSQ